METLVLTNKTGKDVTTSLIIAEVFCKDHKHVLRDIQELECSEVFNQSNFGLISYRDSMNREQRAYEITKDGFSFLVMGYTGAKASEFKVKFINEFNKRESLLKNDDYISKGKTSFLAKNIHGLRSRGVPSPWVGATSLRDDTRTSVFSVLSFDVFVIFNNLTL